MSELIRACKHWVRRRLVATSPCGYWRYRAWRRGDEESELALLPALCDPKRRGTVVDVGANYGMYLARLVGMADRCVAFEPIPGLASMLRRGFGRRVDVHAVALSAERGSDVVLRLPRLRTGYATIETNNDLSSLASTPSRGLDEIVVPRETLDNYALDDVRFMKIDVEGHEEQVLAGAEQTLAQHRPNLLIEVEDRHNAGCVERIMDRLTRLDYAAYVVVDRRLHSLSEFDLADHQRTNSPTDYARNLIGVPHEDRVAVQSRLHAVLEG